MERKVDTQISNQNKFEMNSATESHTKNKKRKTESRMFIIYGVILILFNLILHDAKIISVEGALLLKLQEILFELIVHIGIGLIVLGSLSLLLDVDHWINYFEERLIGVINRREFLKKLSKEERSSLQNDIFKVEFENNSISNTEGFLEYYNKNIKEYIGMPYRTNVNLTLNISIAPNDSNKCDVIETMSYVCKANGDSIQDNISYEPETGEHTITTEYILTLCHKDFEKSTADKKNAISINNEELKKRNALIDPNDLSKGFNLNLNEFKKNDLNVSLTIKYQINKNRFIGWRMSHPTSQLTIQINFPQEFKLAREKYFSEKNNVSENLIQESGSYTLIVRDWILPDEGITFQLN